MRRVGQILIGMLAWTMVLIGGAVAIGMSAFMVAWLVRGSGQAWRELRQGDFEAVVWLFFGLVTGVVGGLVFWAGLSLLRLFDRMEASRQ